MASIDEQVIFHAVQNAKKAFKQQIRVRTQSLIDIGAESLVSQSDMANYENCELANRPKCLAIVGTAALEPFIAKKMDDVGDE